MRFPSVIPVEGFVTGDRKTGESLVTGAFDGTYDPKNVGTLDDLLSATRCPHEYELLSIDIDSHDLDVWEAHQDFSPKMVVIEITSSLAPGILQRQGNQGNSSSSTLSVGRSKGYTLACHTGNMIFVRNDLAPSLGLSGTDMVFPEYLFDRTWLPSRLALNHRASAFLREWIRSATERWIRQWVKFRLENKECLRLKSELRCPTAKQSQAGSTTFLWVKLSSEQ